jgi:hypothetical protein
VPKPIPPYDAGLRDGSVLFWKGGPLARPVLKRTGSDISHAAIILYEGSVPYLYEAVPPCVRRVRIDQYEREMQTKAASSRRPFTWFIMEPKEPYTLAQLDAMKRHADSQIGRRYMLRGWLRGVEARGIFCSEFVSDTVAKSGKIESGGVHESPGGLYNKLLPFYIKNPRAED